MVRSRPLPSSSSTPNSQTRHRRILLWNPSPAGGGGAAADGATSTAGAAASQPTAASTATAFSGRAAFDAVSAAVARVCGPPLPGPHWRADVALLRSSASVADAKTGAGETSTAAAAAADLTAVSFGDDPLTLHLVCARGRNVLTADALAAGPLIAACGGYHPRAKLHLSGPRFAAGGARFGDAGAVVARVAARAGDPPRAVAVVVSLSSASDVAEAAPSLREFAEALQSSVRKGAAEAAEAAEASAEGRRQQQHPSGTLEPLAAPLAEFALPRFPQGPQHAAVQVAALAAAVLARPRSQ